MERREVEPKYAGYYDVAVSNIPFGDVALFDPFFSTHTDPVRRQGTRALHNYFFMKSVDMVREGGLVVQLPHASDGGHEDGDWDCKNDNKHRETGVYRGTAFLSETVAEMSDSYKVPPADKIIW